MLDLFGRGRKIYTVSQLTREIRDLIEGNFFYVNVVGEISNFRIRGDHAYFSLKDEGAILNAVIFGIRGKVTDFEPEEGMKVVCTGRLTVYERRGEYQIIVERMELVGKGKLYQEFERLKKKLAEEGLFDESLKRELPLFPWKIGIVTSPSGAAIRDMLKILREKGVGGEVLLYPSKVQGVTAHLEIIEGIRFFNKFSPVDVIIIGRGGGSFEDLMPFNDENLAREIRKSSIPVISAVGHEIDYTISDFAADRRAPTPTAAAEIIARLQQEFVENFAKLLDQLQDAVERQIELYSSKYDYLSHGLLTYINRLEMRLQDIDNYQHRMDMSIRRMIENKKNLLQSLARNLDNLSPLKVLGRGYSVVLKLPDEEIVTSAKQVKKGDNLKIKVSEGEIYGEVVKTIVDT